ncbi:RL11 Family [Baboon cytomegalovirus]|nr:RL11 Family [Baboon cytomegalovirus]
MTLTTDCDFTLITLQTYVIYVTGNITTTIGSNVSSLTSHNISCHFDLYNEESVKNGNCSTDLCIIYDNDGVTYARPNTYKEYTCNKTELSLYDISNSTTIAYILSQCNNRNDINASITYNVTVAYNPFIPSLPIAEKYTNTKDTNVIAPVVPCVLIVALMIAGYLYYRARIKTRSDHEYKEPQYTTVD